MSIIHFSGGWSIGFVTTMTTRPVVDYSPSGYYYWLLLLRKQQNLHSSHWSRVNPQSCRTSDSTNGSCASFVGFRSNDTHAASSRLRVRHGGGLSQETEMTSVLILLVL